MKHKILKINGNKIVNASWCLFFNKNCKVKGNNNKIIFEQEDLNFPKGLKINIFGDDNYIEIHQTKFLNCYIHIYENNNRFILNKPVNVIEGALFYIDGSSKIVIEEDCELGNGQLHIQARGFLGKSSKVFIGEGTHIAREAIIRTSDGECLIDNNTNKIKEFINDVYIGKHCWITSRCIILKGSILPNNTIVGANSLVNKKITEESTLIAGSPAKIIKRNVKWKSSSDVINSQDYKNDKTRMTVESNIIFLLFFCFFIELIKSIKNFF